jgi:tRNA 5-methylaminomethyl-2-thiouridine biosynthesis bifunctional protein
MPERIEWLDDGTAGGSPFSPRFGDRYRSELGGLDQAKDVFMAGCGLPEAWRSKPQWSILETGFGLGLNFLVTWQAWKNDPLRPRMLHFVSVEAYPASAEDVFRSAATHPELLALATQLKAQLWGLLPGFHRLVFEDGHVLLTLCIGDAKAMLKQQQFEADCVYLDGFSPQKNPDIWDIHTFKAVARCCRRGTRIASWTVARLVRDALAQAGFVVKKTPGIPPKRDNLQGEYNPAWEPKKPASALPLGQPRQASSCIVIGAGLAGAAVAASLARRGWKVVVLDAAERPASGASGLPAGLMAPHISADDSPLSRLSRSGVRMSLQQANARLSQGSDWSPAGVLQHFIDSDNGAAKSLTASWLENCPDAAAEWFVTATGGQLRDAHLPQSAQAAWYPKAAWIKPASLVRAWMATPGIEWRGSSAVAQLVSHAKGWKALDGSGGLLAEAPLIVLAAAHASAELAEQIAGLVDGETLAPTLELQPIRGQVSCGLCPSQGGFMPAFPVNGNGSFIPEVPTEAGLAWFAGASFERDVAAPGIKQSDHGENFKRLQALLPSLAAHLADDFRHDRIQAWSGVRCATPNRLPVLGRLASTAAGDVWISSGMGSRGLTLACLCAELLAAHLHGEPLPLEQRLAISLMP